MIGIHRHSHGAGGSRYLQGPSGSNFRRHSKLEEGFHLLEKPSWSLLQPLFITLKNLKNPRLQPQKGHIYGREHCAASHPHRYSASVRCRRCKTVVSKERNELSERCPVEYMQNNTPQRVGKMSNTKFRTAPSPGEEREMHLMAKTIGLQLQLVGLILSFTPMYALLFLLRFYLFLERCAGALMSEKHSGSRTLIINGNLKGSQKREPLQGQPAHQSGLRTFLHSVNPPSSLPVTAHPSPKWKPLPWLHQHG